MLLLTALLTAHAADPMLTTDLDDDGQEEVVSARVSAEGEVLLTLHEGAHVDTLSVGPFVDFEGPRRHVVLERVDSEPGGARLLRLFVPRGEYCGSGNDWVYLSYAHGELRSALHVHDFSDAPVWSKVQTDFAPDLRTVRVTRRLGDGDETTHEESSLMRFVDGVYQE
jgi:hypothetical protein